MSEIKFTARIQGANTFDIDPKLYINSGLDEAIGVIKLYIQQIESRLKKSGWYSAQHEYRSNNTQHKITELYRPYVELMGIRHALETGVLEQFYSPAYDLSDFNIDQAKELLSTYRSKLPAIKELSDRLTEIDKTIDCLMYQVWPLNITETKERLSPVSLHSPNAVVIKESLGVNSLVLIQYNDPHPLLLETTDISTLGFFPKLYDYEDTNKKALLSGWTLLFRKDSKILAARYCGERMATIWYAGEYA